MKSEMMPTGVVEAEKAEGKSAEGGKLNFVDTRKMAEEAVASNVEFQAAAAADKKESGEQYEKVAGEIKELKSPGEKVAILESQIQKLKKELEKKEQDYKDLTTISTYSNGPGGIDFNGGTAAAALKKYPGADKIVDLLALAADKNKEKKTEEKADGLLGKLGFHKKVQEINSYDFTLIKNALLTGSVGLIENKEKLLAAKETVIAFLKENSPELLKTDKYQEMIKDICDKDEEFKAENAGLLVDKKNLSETEIEKMANTPTCMHDAMGFEETSARITELESRQTQSETDLKLAA